MSYSFRLYSHPNKYLYEHLYEVAELCKEIIKQKVFNDKIYSKELLEEVAYLIGLTHDFGKSTTFFQKHLSGEKSMLAHHSQISSLFAYYVVKEYLKKINAEDEILPLIAWIVVAAHHTDLVDLKGEGGLINKIEYYLENKIKQGKSIIELQVEDIKINTLDEVKKIYVNFDFIDVEKFLNKNELERLFKEIKEKIKSLGNKYHNTLLPYFLTILLYSTLLDADKLIASGLSRPPERITTINDALIENYKEKKQMVTNTYIDQLREKAYKEVLKNIGEIDFSKNRIFTIELPTGCGKTLTGLSFALKLRNRIAQKYGFAPKIIYCLPFISIIDQTQKIIHEMLSLDYRSIPSNLMLTHHHLTDVYYKIKEYEEYDPLKSLLLIEGWHSEIIVTTFVQFFHSLITNKNSSVRKFHNLINSIIILDEVQTIPHKYWNVVSEVLKELTKYNCWIILMTATMPLIFNEEDIQPLVSNRRYYYEALDRIEYNFYLKDIQLDDFNKLVTEKILSTNKDIMIVLNTISSSKKTYQYIRNELAKKFGKPEITEEGIAEFPNLILIYLSSNIIPKHRFERIKSINNKELNKRKIIVSTQVIEAGIDISVDEIYRDFAPLDSIIQTSGRCNRHNEKSSGIVNIYYLKDEKDDKFSHKIYDTLLLEVTEEILKYYHTIKEKDFNLKVIPEYYRKVRSRGEQINLAEPVKNLRFSIIEESFKLIEEEVYKRDVFVVINEEAKKILNEINSILEMKDIYKRREELLKRRKDFFNYVISIDYRNSKYVQETKGKIPYIGKEYYDLETGLSVEDEETLII